jgi:pyrimidine operon attenuation protein/uracil phosphoribosyltransferase
MREILNATQLNAVIDRMVETLAGLCPADCPMAIVGIRTRGVALAERLKSRLQAKCGGEIPMGWLDITLYRDDLHELAANPLVRQTKLDFDPTGMCIVLVDDVLFTGRTVRAALNALSDYGRPKYVKLAVLIDRGHRELPVAADVVGLKVETQRNEIVEVSMSEMDDHDGVVVESKS